MKRLLYFISFCICSFIVWADDSIATEEQLSVREQLKIMRAMEHNVQIYQDEAIDKMLLYRINGTEQEEELVPGYRVQIYSSNKQQTAKAEAFEIENLVQTSNLEIETYVLYNPPFWKVRLGDFKTQEEAKQFREEVIKRLPQLTDDTYIVKDQIRNIK